MVSYRESVAVAAPAETLWRVLVDVEAWPTITESMTAVERLDDGPMRVGSSARVRQPGLPPMIWRVTELDEGRSFTWQASTPGVVTTAFHRITPTDDGCRLTLQIQHTGPLAAVARLVTGRRTRRFLALEAAGLRDRAQALAAS